MPHPTCLYNCHPLPGCSSFVLNIDAGLTFLGQKLLHHASLQKHWCYLILCRPFFLTCSEVLMDAIYCFRSFRANPLLTHTHNIAPSISIWHGWHGSCTSLPWWSAFGRQRGNVSVFLVSSQRQVLSTKPRWEDDRYGCGMYYLWIVTKWNLIILLDYGPSWEC